MRTRSIVLASLLAGAAANGCSKSAPSGSNAASASAVSVDGLTRVADPSQVCMVNNTFMGKPQIPVDVEGRTYYGCCPACKDKLANDPSTRVASDPVTGKQVDKASAVIAYDGDGKVLYFASEDTLETYASRK